MSSVSINDVFEKLIEDENFKNSYFMGYLDRFVYSATDLETDLTSEKRKIAIESLLESFNYLMNNNSNKISPIDIANVGDFINKENGISGFRKINVSAGKFAQWEVAPSSKIYIYLYNLVDNYHNIWNEREVYEKEALFHINLMRIHPFEDGNKRAAKIIMNCNLIKQNYPPVIITEDDTLKYYEFINNEDVEGFAKFLKQRSIQELNTLISSYKVMYNIPITDSILDMLGFEDGSRKA